MAQEIERKFLVKDKSFLPFVEYYRHLKQGYLTSENAEGMTFRVRIADENAFFTVKGRNNGIVRSEFEYPIPLADAEDMLASFCKDRMIEKVRYYLHYEGFLWEIDVFAGRHDGLIIAEIELPDENTEFVKPPFVGDEVSDNFAYSNFALSMS